jgi:hypothetical protein
VFDPAGVWFLDVSVDVEVSASLPAAADAVSDVGVGESIPDISACVALESSDRAAESADVSILSSSWWKIIIKSYIILIKRETETERKRERNFKKEKKRQK